MRQVADNDRWFPRLGKAWITSAKIPLAGYATAREAVDAAKRHRADSKLVAGWPADSDARFGCVMRHPRITRALVQANRRTVFVFGDNMAGRGLGGQAAAMRGEPNVVGVPTKWRPGRAPEDYFSDADYDNPDVRHAIRSAFAELHHRLTDGWSIVIPAQGLGTGLAELSRRAPRIDSAIKTLLAELRNRSGALRVPP